MADEDPLVRFHRWRAQAEVAHPDALTLATAAPSGQPSARMMILRGADERGFVVHTSYLSRKAAELDENPHAALLFDWGPRQVRVEGGAARLADHEADARWNELSRHRQLVIIASPQSRTIGDLDDVRSSLERARRELGTDPPRPSGWGGYRIRPAAYEFWQRASDELHDRSHYERDGAGAWRARRLAP